MMRHLSDSLSFSRTSSSGVFSGSRLGPAGGKFELLLSLPMPVSYSLRARTWGDGRMFLRDCIPRQTTRLAKTRATHRSRRGAPSRAAKLNFASARALPGHTKQGEFDVESE